MQRTKRREFAARSVDGRRIAQAAGRAGIANILNIYTTAAVPSGIHSIREADARPVHTNGYGRPAFPAGAGRSMRIGTATKRSVDLCTTDSLRLKPNQSNLYRQALPFLRTWSSWTSLYELMSGIINFCPGLIMFGLLPITLLFAS